MVGERNYGMNSEVKSILPRIPTNPGVYLFKNKQGKVIYVGKAKNLKNRIKSYFQKNVQHPKLKMLQKNIHGIETFVVDTEVEALILENNLIKKYQPRYNINLKDDKTFPYIRITNEEFPQIFPTRRVVRDGSRYLGPFTDVKNLRRILKGIRKIFPIRSCRFPLTEETIKQGKYKICLDYHIHRCEGPCEGYVSSENYKIMIQKVEKLLLGKTRELLNELNVEMQAAADQLHFEKAARLRDQIQLVQQFYFSPPKVDSGNLEDMDVIAISRTLDDGIIVLIKIRDGKMIGRHHIYLDRIEEKEDEELLEAFLTTKYVDFSDIASEVVLPVELGNTQTYSQYFRKMTGKKIEFIFPQRGNKKKLLDMASKNADTLLQDLLMQKIQRESRIHHAVMMLQKDLRLKLPPIRIEAFDISNIQGTNPVASMVCFENGKPKKSDYRKFHIKSKSSPDDFGMMQEVVERRYQRVIKENLPKPDLILIDGGKGQLNSAYRILKKLELSDIPIIGLAKREEEVFVIGHKNPLNLDKNAPSVKLLRQIRDEAHRFAITFHRKSRIKKNLKSVLEEIEGVGPKRRKILLQSFKNLDEIKNASVETLASLESMNEHIAKKIKRFFTD